jgi:predicted GNAT superfamily acetyltransferase
VTVRDIEPPDLPSLLALNNEHAAELSFAEPPAFAARVAAAAIARAVGAVGAPDAFLLAFDHATPPQGPNHRYFLARHPRFLYVDRVCVAPHARQRGLARALYEDALATAAARAIPVLCCEVNVEPPNPRSDAFHAAMGFHEVARAYLADRDKTVRYLERDVSKRSMRPSG